MSDDPHYSHSHAPHSLTDAVQIRMYVCLEWFRSRKLFCFLNFSQIILSSNTYKSAHQINGNGQFHETFFQLLWSRDMLYFVPPYFEITRMLTLAFKLIAACFVYAWRLFCFCQNFVITSKFFFVLFFKVLILSFTYLLFIVTHVYISCNHFCSVQTRIISPSSNTITRRT